MNFADVLQELKIPYQSEGHRHCRPGWIQIDCPFCGKDSAKFHMGFSLSKQYFTCWKCGPHPVIDTLMESSGLSYPEIKKWMGDVSSEKRILPKKTGKLILPKGIEGLLSAHKRYLRERGFNPQTLERLWGLRGIGIAPKLGWRLFIPIHYRSEIVSWTTRSIAEKGLRYIGASVEEESMNKKDLLYGEDYARHAIIIVEGPTDVWAIGPGAVGTLGTAYKETQIGKMIKYPTRWVCFDNEKEAQKRAQKLVSSLSVFPGRTYNIQLDSKDAGSASSKEIKLLRRLLWK